VTVQGDEILRLWIRQRAQQDAIHYGKHSGGGAGAEGESEERDEGESEIFAERAEGEAKVLEKVVEPGGPASVATIFFYLFGAADRKAGLAASFFRREAARD
jgi:hypothetical protein